LNQIKTYITEMRTIYKIKSTGTKVKSSQNRGPLLHFSVHEREKWESEL
jgi:hypothetical protein